VVLIRRIRELLYDEGFTISGARTRLSGDRDLEHPITTLQPAQQAEPSSALVQELKAILAGLRGTS